MSTFEAGHKRGGAPKGNKNAAKDALWRKALVAALEVYEDKDRGIERGKALEELARQCVSDAFSADAKLRQEARQEIANRLDGKPAQAVMVSGDAEGDAIKHAHTVEWVDGSPPASS